MESQFSKSHVLAGVQDAYWSDDEGENDECPLCLEELDISDMGFKPCSCGYQICRFCWHHIKENLNGKCPACRRMYTEEGIQFTPVSPDDIKRLNQHKKNKERERKELEALNRKHLTNVRVVQRNVVYITGIGPRYAREELIPTLRSNDYFGQYGKITKILLVKRNNPSTGSPVVGLYVTYYRQEDAKRAITTVDGTASFSGHGEITRASYGTTKYCITFLRGLSCGNKSCLDLHEWGDQADCFTKEDLTTLKHMMKDTELTEKKHAHEIPRRHGWSSRPSAQPLSSKGLNSSSATPARSKGIPLAAPRAIKPAKGVESTRREKEKEREHDKGQVKKLNTTSQLQALDQIDKDKETGHKFVTSANASARSSTPMDDSDRGSSVADGPARRTKSLPSQDFVPPGLSLLSASNEPTTYQPSTAAQALLDDVRSRRHQQQSNDIDSTIHSQLSPFPDFDRTLRILGVGSADANGDTGLKFSFDFETEEAPTDADTLNFPLNLSSMGSFGALSRPPPPVPIGRYTSSFDPFSSSPLPGPTTNQDQRTTVSHNTFDARYRGCFDPFADLDAGSSQPSPAPSFAASYDGERTTSRFDFARKGTPAKNFSALPSNLGSEGHRGSPLFSSPVDVHPSSYTFHTEATLSRYSLLPQTIPSRTSTVPPESVPSVPPGLGQAHNQSHSISLSQLFGSNFDATRLSIDAPPPGVEGLGTPEHTQNSEQGSGQRAFTDPAIMSASVSSRGVNPPPGLANVNLQAHSDGWQAGTTKEQNQVRVPFHPLDGPLETFRKSSLSLSQAHTGPSAVASPFQTNPILSESSPPLEPPRETSPPSLLASEFPALPSSGTHIDSAAKGHSVQPHITAPAPKVPENKGSNKTEKRKDESVRKQSFESVPRSASEEKVDEKKDEKNKIGKVGSKSNSASHTGKSSDISKPINYPLTRPAVKEKADKVSSHPSPTPIAASVPEPQAPLLSRQSKKEKKNKIKHSKTGKVKEEETPGVICGQATESVPGKASSDIEMVKSRMKPSQPIKRSSVAEMLSILDRQMQTSLDELSYFNQESVNPKSQTPLQYGPLVHALSALSVGGGTFSNSLPSRSIDTAVSSFQTLLETLTQTISDLLRLLPRTTWDDSASFDGVLRDMLKGDDFFDEPAEETAVKEDEVTALTQALERRARWMEVQLSKLEELHRDINTAAVRAVLALNDRGWDQSGFLPRDGHSVQRFENLARKMVKGVDQPLSIAEMEKKLERCLELEHGAANELRKCMNKLITVKDKALDDWIN